jgi:hypothetical protein
VGKTLEAIVSVQVGTVINTQTTTQQASQSVLPPRFNSTSQPCRSSIVNPELGSLTVPKMK